MGFSKNFKMAAAAVVGTALLSAAGCYNSAKMNESTPSMTHIAPADFTNTVIASTSPVVVDFYATWCGPCRELDPMLDRLAPGYTNSVKFVKVNVDEAPDLAKTYSVQGIPALLMFRDGKLVDHSVGLPTETQLTALLDNLASGKPMTDP
jgi:thioredoxin 1